jgi:hypothetical protein
MAFMDVVGELVVEELLENEQKLVRINHINKYPMLFFECSFPPNKSLFSVI